ncbi:hypothetical protein HY357_01205, partial [Candidatus Roizmanbacteria bacterium]|nr:hypothetical protein [Candidatus Roizmanbacteria bacterium]
MAERRIDWNKVLLVLTVAFISAALAVLHVLIGFAKTPLGTVYLWTGHYYLDYYYYLQFIAQGLRGYWLPRQYSATDDPSIYFHLEAYVGLGQMGRIFNLPPIAIYWSSVFILTFLLSTIIFFVIREILEKKPFYVQFGAFLLTLSAGPFYKIISEPAGLRFLSFEYWASYGTFFKRFEPVPHHLLAHIFTLIVCLLFVRYLKKKERNFLASIRAGLLISFFIIVELSFYPFQIVILFAAIVLTSLVYGLYDLKKKLIFSFISLVFFVAIVGTLTFLAGLIIKNVYDQTVFFRTTKGVETGWRNMVAWQSLILNFGPIFILALLGIQTLIRKINLLQILLTTFFIVSLFLFYTP